WNVMKEDIHEHMEDDPEDALEGGKIWQREIEHAIEPKLKTLSQQNPTPRSAPFVHSTILNPIDLGIKVDLVVTGIMLRIILVKSSNQKGSKPPKMSEFNLGDFRWEWIKGAAHKRFKWGCGYYALKTQTREDKNPTNNVNNSIRVKQSYQYLRYEGLQYTNADILDFELRLTRIHMREVHRVQVFDFRGLPDLMAKGLSTRMLMEHRDAQGFILALGLHTKEMQTVGFGAYWAKSARQIPNKGDLRYYLIGISSAGDFLGTALFYNAIQDLILRLCHRLIACSIAGRSQAPEKVTVTDMFYLRRMDIGSVNSLYLLARYLRLFAAVRKSEAHITGWYEGLQYINADILDFELRLTRIHMREVHRVQVFDFGGLPDLMAKGLSTRMLMEHRDAQGVSLFTSQAWRWVFNIRGRLHTKEMQTVGFGAYWAKSARQIPNKGDLRYYLIGISSAGDFLGTALFYNAIQDLILRLCHRLIACSIAGR
nr:hypothetical protein [Tanacetum cinerariifolium]